MRRISLRKKKSAYQRQYQKQYKKIYSAELQRQIRQLALKEAKERAKRDAELKAKGTLRVFGKKLGVAAYKYMTTPPKTKKTSRRTKRKSSWDVWF